MNSGHAYGEFTSPGELRFVRVLPGPIERVWESLTDPAKRGRWLAFGRIEPRIGGENHLEFHNTKLSAPGDDIPEKYVADCSDGCGFTGRITRWEPPRVLAHTWGEADGSASEVTFELSEAGDGRITLVLTHRRLGDSRDTLLSVSAGWHTHLAILLAELAGTPAPSFWSTHTQLESDYAMRLAATR